MAAFVLCSKVGSSSPCAGFPEADAGVLTAVHFDHLYHRSLPGEVVADICAGSGTTAVAAVNTGRHYICFENAPAFYSPAAERVRRAERAGTQGGKGV